MSDKLKDASKAAHEIVEVVLQTANENPWYVMATIYGEQAGAQLFDYNLDLTAKNRRAWNLWFCQGLDDAELAERANYAGLKPTDLQPNADSDKAAAELEDIRERFRKRMQEVGVIKDELPSPKERIDFSNVNFEEIVDFSKYIFLQACTLRNATFNKCAYFKAAVFCDGARFRSTNFKSYAGFRDVVFFSEAYFYYAEFNSHTHFEGARF